jgi:ATP-dependent DNA helicase DinG
MNVGELLGPSGSFARSLPGYEARPGQMDMANAVQRCLEQDGILLCEGGTGTGKTLAYLVPALLGARQKTIVISTATRALQDQIFYKDLPLAQRVLGLDTPAVLIKGLSNYLCRRRYKAFMDSGASLEPRFERALPLLEAWATRTESGAVEELGELGEDDPLWPLVTSSSETRVGGNCPHFDDCFVTRMKRQAASARILVVNHHLFFADLALRGPHPGAVLPPYDAVIFDEAHQLEDVATRYFGLSVSSARVARLVRDARTLFALPGPGGGWLIEGPCARIEQAAQAFFDALEQAALASGMRTAAEGERRSVVEPELWVGSLQAAWFSLDAMLDALAGVLDEQARAARDAAAPSRPVAALTRRAPLARDPEGIEILVRRARALQNDLSAIVQGQPGSVAWFEANEQRRVLSASPIELGGIFQKRLFEVAPAVVLTSATLTSSAPSSSPGPPSAEVTSPRAERAPPSGEAMSLPAERVRDDEPERPPPEPTDDWGAPEITGPFRFVRERFGLHPALYRVEELVVPSPFDFAAHALLYVADDLPLPTAREFSAAAAERAAALIALSGGGAFVLTTSVRSMQAIHRRLATLLGSRPLFVQGQAPKSALVERFRAAGDAVLVATQSFWQGVDVPGEALRLVILEKAPFPVPTDPLIQARSRALELAGYTPFTRLHLPLAKLALKQGFGRLIRTRSDYGVVALLDVRAKKRGYGERLLEGLPPAPRVSSLEGVKKFWESRQR